MKSKFGLEHRFFLSHVHSWNVSITYISLRLPSLIQFEKTLPAILLQIVSGFARLSYQLEDRLVEK